MCPYTMHAVHILLYCDGLLQTRLASSPPPQVVFLCLLSVLYIVAIEHIFLDRALLEAKALPGASTYLNKPTLLERKGKGDAA